MSTAWSSSTTGWFIHARLKAHDWDLSCCVAHTCWDMRADGLCRIARTAKNSAIHAGNGTFFSDSPDDLTSMDAIKGSYQDSQHGKQKSGTSRSAMPTVPKPSPKSDAPSSDIAPWMDPAPPHKTSASTTDAPSSNIAPWMDDDDDELPKAMSTHGLTSGNYFNEGPPQLHLSSNYRPDTQDSDSTDPIFRTLNYDERRPSMASATTQDSSQTSVSKTSTNKSTPYKKVANIFGDEGRQSSRSSDTSIPTSLQREPTGSSRLGSSHTKNASYDDGRQPQSPTSSRSRTPPPSDVTPWLFQDYKVSMIAYSVYFRTMFACVIMWFR